MKEKIKSKLIIINKKDKEVCQITNNLGNNNLLLAIFKSLRKFHKVKKFTRNASLSSKPVRKTKLLLKCSKETKQNLSWPPPERKCKVYWTAKLPQLKLQEQEINKIWEESEKTSSVVSLAAEEFDPTNELLIPFLFIY